MSKNAVIYQVLRSALIGAWGTTTFFVPAGWAAAPSPADLDFFEKRIRPILVEHCYECHSGEKNKGGLRLDSPAGWLNGGDSGAAIVPSQPDESLLVEAVRYAGLEMPPAGKLSAEKIALLEEWVARGAPAPHADEAAPAKSARAAIDLEAGRKFWAYQPPRAREIPELSGVYAATQPIDGFINARLQAAGLQPGPVASRAVLVRRLYFDLWGLPPEVADIAAAEQDSSADWYERLVDRLLASPHFGERWARHWLDVVRFGESLTLRGFIMHEAWRYRDYVIDSFNRDLPYDQFVREQLAGDLLPASTLADQRRRLAATTFLALGNTNLEEQDKRQLDMDVVDEQLDVIGKAFLAQTIGCARCHDHKFDPIPTRDYYALAGILRSTQLLDHENVSKWKEVPLPLAAEEEETFARDERAVAALAREVGEIDEAIKRLAGLAQRGSAELAAVESLAGVVVDDSKAKKVGDWQASQSTKPYIGDGYLHDRDQGKGDKTVTFVPELPASGRYEIRLAYTPGGNRAEDVPVTVFSADGEKLIHVNMQQTPPIDGHFVSLGQFRCEAAGQSFVIVSNEGTTGHVVVDAVQFLPSDENQAPVKPAGERPGERAAGAPQASLELAEKRRQHKELTKELKQLRAAQPKRPAVMTVVEREKIEDSPVHIRGSVHTLGDVVPRGFLQVVAPAASQPLPAGQSGRRELADWIASPENPLTARVLANRVWHWLLGAGLVRSVDNFGTTGEEPSHPELLDYLAVRLVERNWSVKQLVREIVLSDVYRRSSIVQDDALQVDPENRLLAYARRKRLEAECLRDALLAVSGALSSEVGGSSIPADRAADYDYVDTSTRRSVYVPVFRNALPEIFEAFDFPDPSLVVGRRDTSTVATQALFLMNNPLIREQAAEAARRLLAEDFADERQRIDQACLRTLGRRPTAEEAAVFSQALASEGADDSPAAREHGWASVFHLLFSALDFRYCD